MNSIETKSFPNPREKASLVSKLFFWWTKTLLKKAYVRPLLLEDLCDPLEIDRASLLGDQLEKHWNEQLALMHGCKGKPSLWKALFYTFKKEFLIKLFHQAVDEIFLLLAIPLIFFSLLHTFKPKSNSTYMEALLWASALVVVNYIKGIFKVHKLSSFLHLGGRMRIAVTSLIYRKALRLSKTTLSNTSSEKIINLIANSVHTFDYVLLTAYYVWSTPISTLLMVFILFTKFGLAAVFGMATLLAIIPLQIFFGYLSVNYKRQAILKTDERIKLLGEIISAIQVIKIYTWEKPFYNLIKTVRKQELKIIGKSAYSRNISLAFHNFASRIAIYCAIVAMVAWGVELSAENVFVLFPFYFLLADTVTCCTKGLKEVAEFFILLRKVQSFLLLDESPQQKLASRTEVNNLEQSLIKESKAEFTRSMRNPSSKTWAVKIDNLSVKWDLNISDNTLENVNLKLDKGKLYIVIGMVGTGKSSLLSSILREINIVSGEVQIDGVVTYAGQDPWIFGDTIRQNILFGETFDEQRYQRTIEACSLIQDFKQLPQGDGTIVGEKGVSLSGGQKARINFARAVYRQADIYLLDDPLSAVDVHVGNHLFQNCIADYLKNKTRILVTHQLQYIKNADGIILVDQANVQYYTTYHQLLHDYPKYSAFISGEEDKEPIKEKNERKSVKLFESKSEDQYSRDHLDMRKLEDVLEKSPNESAQGSMLLKFFQSGSNIFIIAIAFLIFIITQLSTSSTDVFVFLFINEKESRNHSNGIKSFWNTNFILHETRESSYLTEMFLYTILVLTMLIFNLVRSLVYSTLCLRSSKSLHNSAFCGMLRTPLRFFHKNSSGRILNRFSRDVSTVDEFLPWMLMEAVQIFSAYIGALIVTSFVNPVFSIAVLTLAVLYCFIMIFYRVYNNIKGLEGIARAPMFTHLNETLNGLPTIRAYRAEEVLKTEFEKFQDVCTSAWYNYELCKFVYAFVIKLFNCTFIMAVVFGIVIFKDHFNGCTAALVISQLLSMSEYLPYGSLLSADITNRLTAVPRLLEYAKLPHESEKENAVIKKKREKNTSTSRIFPQDWPRKGCIEFKNVSMQYSKEDEFALKNLNFYIQSKEKVGIVGRTGAGKSSLISALYRLTEIEGTIEIDGIDIKSIPLDILRSSLSIIPQDPILFSGTLRHNLDPSNEYFDHDIWEALEQVNMKEIVTSSPSGLNYLVLNKGSNFSIGQRQLLCLARAILRKNRILLIDEATANVDRQTDSLVQQTIREKFNNCTVITVAHRLNTIIDSDKVIVMNEGQVVEFDHPYNLLCKRIGWFTALVEETDDEMFQELFEIAKQCYDVNCKMMNCPDN